MLMEQSSVAATQRQQTAVIARFDRDLCDQLGRKLVIIGIDAEKIRLVRQRGHSCVTAAE